ncbi:MAG: ABC-F family ATP-binding cassette domain-containing protein [Thermanaerothrix sp.]|nr:ABC-F family ATP-binding cassette domain-containing protein [Thermanaerothrix sp.]
MEGSGLIILEGVSLRYGERVILDNAGWVVTTGQKVALVGPNGCGKTSLMRLLAGEDHPESGTVTVKALQVGYLPQDIAQVGPGSVMEYLKSRSGLTQAEAAMRELEARMGEPHMEEDEAIRLAREHDGLQSRIASLGGYSFEARAKRVLSGLGFEERDYERDCSDFSGGWKMRILLASILLSQPEVLLLDEPTNHLDTESMEWLEGYLKSFDGTMVAVSHDRRFINRTTGAVAEIRGGKIRTHQGSYESYLKAREAEDEELRRRARDVRELRARTMAFVERFRYKASKASQAQSRLKALERIEETGQMESARELKIKIPAPPRGPELVMSAQDLGMSYDGRWIFRGVRFEVHRGDRVALVGYNGSGKSTLMRLMGLRESPSEGTLRLGSGVRTAFFSQESATNLDYGKTVLEEARSASLSVTDQDVKSTLGAFLLGPDYWDLPVEVLSGGEKSRLTLAKMLMEPANLLLLDEPTNHLDERTKEIFASALGAYQGTLVIVSHDRDFLDAVVNRVFEIRRGTLREYLGNYSRFAELRGELDGNSDLPGEESKRPRRDLSSSKDSIKEERRRRAEDRNRIYRLKKAVLDRMAPIEEAIGAAEARKGELEGLLCSPEVLGDSSKVQSLMLELSEINRRLEALYPQWEALAEELDAIGR